MFINSSDYFFSKALHDRFSRAANVATKAAIVISSNSVNIRMSRKCFLTSQFELNFAGLLRQILNYFEGISRHLIP